MTTDETIKATLREFADFDEFNPTAAMVESMAARVLRNNGEVCESYIESEANNVSVLWDSCVPAEFRTETELDRYFRCINENAPMLREVETKLNRRLDNKIALEVLYGVKLAD